MSRLARTGALLGTGVALTAALSGVAHAAPAPHMKADCYVLVFSAKNYKGSATCIVSSKKKLTGKWNDSISSVSIDKACTVTLYQNASYKGKSSTWKRTKPAPGNGYWNVPDLKKYKVGDNKTSSIKRECAFNT
jgi:hypothetical protein